MKKLIMVLALLSTGMIGGCFDDKEEEQISPFATKAFQSEAEALISSLRRDVDSIESDLMKNKSDVSDVVELIDQLKKIKKNVDANTAFIKSNELMDFKDIENLKIRVSELESNSQKKIEKKERLKKKENIKQQRKDKIKLNVFVSKVNNWGGEFIAIINIPSEGFKALPVYSYVGNGWSISRIDKASVSFVHNSGLKKVIYL